jgi:hypothetical protein
LTFKAGRSNKGKIPSWFTLLENKLIKDHATRKVFTQFEIVKEVFEEYNNKGMTKNKWSELEACFSNTDNGIDDELDRLLEIDNRFSVIEKVFVKGEGYKIVEEAFLKNIDRDKNNILYIYTDAGKKGNNCSIGWTIFNDKDQLIAKHYLKINNNFEVIELEILAILTAIFTIRSGSKINLFTDNLGVC